MRKYENQSKQKFGKNACDDLGNLFLPDFRRQYN